MAARYMRLAIVLLAALQLAGCYTDLGPVEVGTGAGPLSGASVASLLQPGEKLKITVYGEENLTGDYDVTPAGYVTMPLIGAIKAAGRSQSQFGSDIAARFRRGGVSTGSPRDRGGCPVQAVLRARRGDYSRRIPL